LSSWRTPVGSTNPAYEQHDRGSARRRAAEAPSPAASHYGALGCALVRGTKPARQAGILGNRDFGDCYPRETPSGVTTVPRTSASVCVGTSLTLPEPEPPPRPLALRLLRTGLVVVAALGVLAGLGYGAVALVTPSQPPGSVPGRAAGAPATTAGPPPGIVFLDIDHLSMTGYRPRLTAALLPQDSYAFAPDPSGRVLVAASGRIVDPAVPASERNPTIDLPPGFRPVRQPWADGGRSLLLATVDRLVLWNRSTGALQSLGAGTGAAPFGGILETGAAADPSRAAAVVVVPGKQVFGSYGPVTASDRVEYRSVGGGTRVLLTAERFRSLVGLPRSSAVVLSANVSAHGHVAVSGSGLDARGNDTPSSVVVLRRDGRLAAVVRAAGGRSWFPESWSPGSPVLALGANVNDAGGNPTEVALYLLNLDRADHPTKVDLPLPPPNSDGRSFLGTVSWSPDGTSLVAGTDRAWFVVGFSPYAVSTFVDLRGNPVGWLRLPTGGR